MTTANPNFPPVAASNIRTQLGARLGARGYTLAWWLALALLTLAVWTILQYATPNIIGYDGYYHIKIAEVMRRAGLAGIRLDFIWLPLSILSPDKFADHHYLFHVLLIPFTLFDLTQGAKIAALVFAAVTFLTIAWSLRKQNVFGAFFWTLSLFLLSDPFLFRLAMPRAQSLSLLVLILGIQWMIDQKYRWLAPLAFVYVWLYNAFLLLPVVAVLYGVAVLLIERRLAWKGLVYVAVGTGVGFVLHPFTPNNILFFIEHLYPKFIQPTTASVGSEWDPYQTWTLVKNSGPALALFLVGALGLGLRAKRMTAAELTWFFCAIAFAVMLFQARRFIEYYPAFALVFCAVIWSEPLREFWHNASRRPRALALAALAVVALIAGAITLRSAYGTIAAARPGPIFAGASQWLSANTPEGARVFQTDWDDFPQLYFYNDHNTYIIGLDPTYMELYDRKLYDTWVKLTRVEIKKPADVIRQQFGAEYVISDLDHETFINAARNDPQFEIVYSDNTAIVFHIR